MPLPKPRTLILCVAVVLLAAGCATRHEPANETRVLPNGIQILAKENRASGVVALRAMVRDGALYEQPDEAGLAHVLSLTMFDRTAERGSGEIPRRIIEMGGVAGVNARYDFVDYAVVAPSQNFSAIVDLLADGLQNAVFDSARFERVRSGVLRGIEDARKRPIDRAHLMCMAELFGDHPYGRAAAGTPEGLRSLTLKQVREHYREHYVGANILISVSGDVDPGAAADAIAERLYGIAAGEPATPAAPPIEWPAESTRVVRKGDVRTAYQVLCFPGPSITDEDSIAMDILLIILTGGRSSRLARILSEERTLVTSVDAGWYTLVQPSPLYVWMELPPDNVEEAERAVVEIFRDLAETGATEEELEKAKTFWETQVLFQNETAEGQAFFEGYWTLLGWPGLPTEYIERLDLVTGDDVRRAASRYLNRGTHSTAVLLPEWAD